ncbi:MAG: hypothetical protein LBF58_07920, partial [Deltaproteobacteria bacterium]|nr:hypothetical protein [Deltaproteobacteria bacterium]
MPVPSLPYTVNYTFNQAPQSPKNPPNFPQLSSPANAFTIIQSITVLCPNKFALFLHVYEMPIQNNLTISSLL